MSGFDNDVVYAKNADFTQADNQNVSESNGLATNGQLWIGTTSVNAGGTHVNVGALTSPLGTVAIGYSSPNITLDLSGGGVAIDSLTPNSGTSPVVPDANGNIVLQGTGSITTVGGLNSLTPQLTGLTNHSVLVGAGTATITKVGPSTTTGQILQNNAAADPSYSTATYPSTTNVNEILYSNATNTVSGLTTVNRASLSTNSTGVPTWLPLTDGQVVIGSTAGSPATSTLTGATGVSITNASNSITIGLNGAVVGQTITGDTGGALNPTAGNWNILGQQAVTVPVMDTIGSGSTLSIENRTWLTSLIVDPSTTNGLRGTFSTIQSAITAATAGQTVYIRDGSYTENLTLKVGVNLTTFTMAGDTPNVTIIGNATLSTAGTVSISNVRLQTNSAALLTVSGSAASILNLNNCYLNCSNNTGIAFSAANTSSTINIFNCKGNIGTTGIALFSMSSTGTLNFNQSIFTNTGNSTTANTVSAGSFVSFYSIYANPFTTSSTGIIAMSCVTINCAAINTTALTHGGNTASNFNYCTVGSGSASAISISTTLSLYSVVISSNNTNAITGAGTLIYVGVIFQGTSSKINTTTQTGGVMQGGLTQAPSAGFIGERITAQATAQASTTGTSINITSINLTAGIWDVSTIALVVLSGANSTASAGPNTTSATLPTTGGVDYALYGFTNVGPWNSSLVTPSVRFTLTATTTVYLVAQATFTTGTAAWNGRISATRVG